MQHKYIKIQRERNEPILPDEIYERTEKLDGANFSFLVGEDDELVFRSRNKVIGDKTGNFTMAINFIKSLEYKFDIGRIYFGECMTKHTIFYGDTVDFIGFGVFDVETETYLGDWKQMFDAAGITTPKREFIKGSLIHGDVEANLNMKSQFGTSGATQEGCVYKCYTEQSFVKFVRDQFKEDNRKAFKGGLVPEDDTGKIVARFCTFGRIEKKANDIRMEMGTPIDLPMMQTLPKFVCDDIISEEWATIYNKYVVVDFKKYRKLVSHECLRFLKEYEGE